MAEENNRILALFDFDGTITKHDTLLLFLKYYKGAWFFLKNMVIMSPILVLYLLRIIPNWKAKQLILKRFLFGETITVFHQKCHSFVRDVLPADIRPSALKCIKNHQRSGAKVIVVTASPENWVNPWCAQIGLSCIGTRLEVVNGKLTGKLVGYNCYGQEKVRRISDVVELNQFHQIEAYGDSKGDRPMLKLATHPHYKVFKD